MSTVELWLQPLPEPDDPCGKDTEYDSDFLDLIRVSQGKPETQFGPGEAPDWRDVLEKSEALLERTRDLRIAVLWLRASLNLRGFAALSPGLELIHGLLSNFWEHVHPALDPDDGDAYARINALAVLPEAEGVLGDLRQCALFNLRGSGPIRVRSVLTALNQIVAKSDEASISREQLSQMIASAIEQNPEFLDQPRIALDQVKSLVAVMNDRFGAASAPDLSPVVDLLKYVSSVMPVPVAEVSDEAGGDGETGGEGRSEGRSKAALGSVSSREDALRAIDLVCDYLDRTEPTNPAQLFLRRARRLINHNFLQLIKELAPEALNEAARIMGVDPESIDVES